MIWLLFDIKCHFKLISDRWINKTMVLTKEQPNAFLTFVFRFFSVFCWYRLNLGKETPSLTYFGRII